MAPSFSLRSRGGSARGRRAWGPHLASRREGGGHPSRSSLRPVGSPWAGVESCLPPVSAPWTRVLFQILTTVLTGHVPDCLLRSSLPSWREGSLWGGLPSLDFAGSSSECVLQACADGLVSAQTAGLQQGFPLREEAAVSVRSLIGVH